jgi:hypothetical protein
VLFWYEEVSKEAMVDEKESQVKRFQMFGRNGGFS